jgi:hypothetical protein
MSIANLHDSQTSNPLTLTPLQNFPEHQFPSIVGRPILRSEERAGDIVVKDIMCGDEAAAARSMLQISYPVCAASAARPLPCYFGLDH